jgi:hypothetical protein
MDCLAHFESRFGSCVHVLPISACCTSGQYQGGVSSAICKRQVVIFWFNFIPHIHLTIALSLRINLVYSSFCRAQHSLVYSMILWTQAHSAVYPTLAGRVMVLFVSSWAGASHSPNRQWLINYISGELKLASFRQIGD